ncbi:MAG: S1/P1 nuclease [Acidobacteriia bacterium]|nr:S1/P1 nuclease [Terriglobia bacterium]
MTALAWGPEGHSLVARIADAQLTPATRARVTAILAPGQTMASIASWADEARRTRADTAPWHFIDIPISQSHLDMARDCPKNACIIAEIADLRKTLEDPATPADRQREALMFLVHFIGDMHEPLHCSDNNDRGGNSVRVVFFQRQTNLHSVWDSGLLGRLAPADQLFPVWSRESARRAKKWSKGTVEQWAEQSHKAAQKVVYGRLPKAPAGTAMAPAGTAVAPAGTPPITLGAAYEKRRPIRSSGNKLKRRERGWPQC